MIRSMRKQPKERPAPEDLMVSETSEPPVWLFSECFLLLYTEVEFWGFLVGLLLPILIIIINSVGFGVGFFFLYFSVCTNLNYFGLVKQLHSYREHTKGGILMPVQLMGILLFPLLWPKLCLWFGQSIQNFHRQYQFPVRTILMLNALFFFSLYVRGLQPDVGHALPSFASLNLSKCEDWKLEIWSKQCIFNDVGELLFSLIFT